MKKTWVKFFPFLFAIAFLVPACLVAQENEKDQKEKTEKAEKKEKLEKMEKKEKDNKDVQQLIVTLKAENDEKTVIEVNGDKITINGKPIDEYKDKDGNISVRLQKFKELGALARIPWNNSWNENGDESMELFSEDSNHAMLGVTTEKAEGGVEVQDVTKGSAAEKAGLKEGDVIAKIDDKSVDDPDDLSKAIREHKPGDKVVISYSRDKKDEKVTAELGKWKGMGSFSYGPQNFKVDMNGMNLNNHVRVTPKIATPYGNNYGGGSNWFWQENGSRLGLSVQDADDGKGVKVIDVDEEGNAAKAGIKEDDVITEVDGKAVNGADEIAKVIKDSKTKISVMVKLMRDGKPMSIEVKMPRKLKTADL